MSPLERIAHDIICIVKFGSPGGTASATDVKNVAAYLARIGTLPEPERPKPTIAAILREFKVTPPAVVVKLPAIRIAPPKP